MIIKKYIYNIRAGYCICVFTLHDAMNEKFGKKSLWIEKTTDFFLLVDLHNFQSLQLHSCTNYVRAFLPNFLGCLQSVQWREFFNLMFVICFRYICLFHFLEEYKVLCSLRLCSIKIPCACIYVYPGLG